MTPKVATNVLAGLPVESAIAASAQFLRAHGYAVTEPKRNGEEFTIGELCAIFDLPHSTLAKRLSHADCPPSFRRLGSKGRILSIALTPDLEAWLAKPLQPGRKLVAAL